jgi:hypothetical protein
MELQDIANCIAAAETALLSGCATHIDFHAGQLLCRVARINGNICYFYRTLYPVRAESAQHLASIAFAAQHPQPKCRPHQGVDPIAAHRPNCIVA